MRIQTLFSGMGGAEHGLVDFKVTAIAEIDQAAAFWNPCANNLGDVLDLQPDQINTDVLWISPPCQSFSMANPGRGAKATDWAIAEKIIDLVKFGTYQCVYIENVSSYFKSPVGLHVMEQLNLKLQILNARRYGSYSNRIRGILSNGPKPVEPFCLPNWRRVFFDSQETELTKNQKIALKDVKGDCLISRWAVRGQMRIMTDCCCTITASMGHDGKGSERSPLTAVIDGIPYRAGSEELARLMGFSFLVGEGRRPNNAALSQAIGNAVSPKLSQALLNQLVC
jgi:site-specific DNA-cytosine methylase